MISDSIEDINHKSNVKKHLVPPHMINAQCLYCIIGLDLLLDAFLLTDLTVVFSYVSSAFIIYIDELINVSVPFSNHTTKTVNIFIFS